MPYYLIVSTSGAINMLAESQGFKFNLGHRYKTISLILKFECKGIIDE
jgi:hypothetical protein